jgi:hypothetical protein
VERVPVEEMPESLALLALRVPSTTSSSKLMPTPTIDPFVSPDPYVQGRLVAMGAHGASTDPTIQANAISMLSPGVIVPGASGVDQNGRPTQYQAYTTSGREGVEGTPGLSLSSAPVFRPASDTMPMRASFGSDQAYLQAYNAYQAAGQPSYIQGAPGAPTPYGGTPGAGSAPGAGASGTTPGQVYSGLVPTGNPELDAAYDAQGRMIQGTQAPVDEQSIRDATMKRFQAEIDATTQYYNEVKRQRQAEESVRGLGRVGTGVAVQARRGLIGSDFGNAQGATVDNYNSSVQDGIARAVDSERNNAIQEILGKARTESQQEINAKLAARTKGAQDYIDFLKGSATRKDERANSAIANLIASGQEPDNATYDALAKELGMDVAALRTKYKEKADAAKTETAKNAPKPVIIDGVGYTLQDDGTYKAVTPAKPVAAEKPIIVGGVAYEKSSDGTYKAVTPVAAVKPLTRQVGKVLMTSLDNGVTWQPATTKTSSGLPTPKGTTPTTRTTTGTKVTAPNATAEMKVLQQRIGQGVMFNENGNPIAVGGDGKLSPQDYLTLRNKWVASGLSPTTFDTQMKGYRDAKNTAYPVGK